MIEVENQTLNLLKNIIENRDKIFESINEAKEKLIPIVNIINILGNTYYEVSNSSLLYNILKIKSKYDNKEINFAKDFSLYIVGDEYKDKIKNAKFKNVYREFQTKDGRRIDILIVFDKFEIIIENKINAGDQENQLLDYYNDRYNNGKEIFLVYLTRWKYEASEYSISKETKEELKDKIYYLSHGDIAEWIENDILNKYEFLKFDKKYQSIYSALIQIRDNEKIITNPNEENNMEKEEIKKFFEKNNYFDLSNNNKLSMENFNDMYQLLKNSKEVIIDYFLSKDIEYYSNIKSEVEQYIKDKGTYYVIASKEQVSDRFYSGTVYSQNMAISIENNWNARILLEQHINYHLCVSIYSNNNDIANKLREEPIKTEIGDILDKKCNSDKYEEDEERYYIYSLYIDTEKYKPEYIADKIIKLYEFLKDNINFDNA